jgi:superfamily I DNA and/or RNA helicase
VGEDRQCQRILIINFSVISKVEVKQKDMCPMPQAVDENNNSYNIDYVVIDCL